MTEQQQYEVVSKIGSVELRRYARCTVADVVMQGSAASVGSQAFRPLVRYISSAQLSMTAPVLQSSTSTSTPTSPSSSVSAASSSSSDSWVVSFVLPGSKGIGDYPLPTDAQVTLREMPSHLALATTWSGRWSYSSVESNTASLLSVLSDPGSPLSATYVQVSSPVWARYDPPWKPWFLRRNEVLIEVRTLE
jgi:SOUL heme-binding protein